jgi:hypothetical protein
MTAKIKIVTCKGLSGKARKAAIPKKTSISGTTRIRKSSRLNRAKEKREMA